MSFFMKISIKTILRLVTLGQFKSLSSSSVSANKLSDVAISKVLKIVSFPDTTVHGLRSSFRDWCGDNTDFSIEV